MTTEKNTIPSCGPEAERSENENVTAQDTESTQPAAETGVPAHEISLSDDPGQQPPVAEDMPEEGVSVDEVGVSEPQTVVPEENTGTGTTAQAQESPIEETASETPANNTTEININPVSSAPEENTAPAPEETLPADADVPVDETPEDTVIESANEVQSLETPAANPVQEEPEMAGTPDFSEEDAMLDADLPEFELKNHGIEEEDGGDPVDINDINDLTKDQLLNRFAELLSDKPVQAIRRDVEAIKIAFYKIHRAEVETLRKRFIDEGGLAEDFAPAPDPSEQRLKDLFGEYRRKRDEYIANLERSKEDNLQIKLKIIEDLKELTNGSETLNHTFQMFRDLQQRWRDAGPVPQANVKDLWDTYNHHVENFYSYIKINKELRDLDLKKNLEAKTALCEEAESLILDPSIVNAFYKLQKLHEEWRETGPVANEYKEALWDRFREASSRINKQHQDHFEKLKEDQKQNLELKTELCLQTERLAAEVLTTRKEWNKASDKLLEIQKVWKTIGFAPRKDNTRIYERFRTACDVFFDRKRSFYMQFKAEMDHNLQLKNEICEAAESLSGSEDWKKTTDELIALQKKWKETGPVARRHSDAVWKRFRAACDVFFQRKAEHFKSRDSEQDENLARKKELLEEIRQADIVSGGYDLIKEFQRRWQEIGFVPIKQKDAVQREYKEVMDNAFSALRGSGQARNLDRFRDKVSGMKESGDRRLRFERDKLYNKVRQLESDIALLENNIGFFSNSKNAEGMIADVRSKIEKARREMEEAIEKINLIDKQDA